jgi:hypothetical protein
MSSGVGVRARFNLLNLFPSHVRKYGTFAGREGRGGLLRTEKRVCPGRKESGEPPGSLRSPPPLLPPRAPLRGGRYAGVVELS